MLKRLSYTFSKKAPAWPGVPAFEIQPYSLISEGKATNEFQFTLYNHFGSHMDGPKHFNDKGPRLGELPLETFFYEQPLLVDIPKSYGELVTRDELIPFEEQLKKADLLMIRSGFSEKRVSDPEGYSSRGPGVGADACTYLMDHFPKLKAVALDWISLASYLHLDEGILAHQYLLGKHHDHFICIIEDLDFSVIQPAEKIKKVWSVPLFMEEVDSAPATVIAELEKQPLSQAR